MGTHHNPQRRQKPRLLDQVRAAIRTRHYSRRTERAYVDWIRRYILFHNKRHPLEMAEAEVNQFLTELAVRGNVASSTQNQALAAILFLYKHVLDRELGRIEHVVRAKKPRRLPVILTAGEVKSVLDQLEGVCRLVAKLLYGSGLRLNECLEVRVQDLDFGQNQIVVRDPKGGNDRYTLLPTLLQPAIKEQLHKAKRVHERDLRRGYGRVQLPNALARKYPSADREWRWQWVFPATRLYYDREANTRRRYHLHDSVVQKAVHVAGNADPL